MKLAVNLRKKKLYSRAYWNPRMLWAFYIDKYYYIASHLGLHCDISATLGRHIVSQLAYFCLCDPYFYCLPAVLTKSQRTINRIAQFLQIFCEITNTEFLMLGLNSFTESKCENLKPIHTKYCTCVPSDFICVHLVVWMNYFTFSNLMIWTLTRE